MNIGIILAGGQGTRFKCKDKNKTSLTLHQKPLVQYGVDLYQQLLDETIVVVGAYAESVKSAIKGKKIIYAVQTKQLGTGHAALIAVEKIMALGKQPKNVFIGYGDHMMFYTPSIVKEMLVLHQKKKAAITLVSVRHGKPDLLAWGRIVRDTKGKIISIVEQKEATLKQRKIQELNAGFYCFNFDFLRQVIFSLQPSPLTHEYYLTDLIDMAVNQKRTVISYDAPFKLVGIGVNTLKQLKQSRELMKRILN